VDEGDTITLAVKVYAPFVTDPPILRVKKPEALSSPPGPLDEGASSNPDPMLEAEPSTIPDSPLQKPASP